MKPKERLKALVRLSFRPEGQGNLFESGDGPVVVLLSDVQTHFKELEKELGDGDLELRKLRREITSLRKAKGTTKRGYKEIFPDILTVPDEARIRRACETYGVDFKAVLTASRLYSEAHDVKYVSWPAAIEVALLNDYQWIRSARGRKITNSSDKRRNSAGEIARRILGESAGG